MMLVLRSEGAGRMSRDMPPRYADRANPLCGLCHSARFSNE